MINKLANWLQSQFQVDSTEAEPHSLELAIAVLYQEIMRADAHYHEHEHAAFKKLAFSELHVSEQEWLEFEALSRTTAEQAVDFVQFTQIINRNCDETKRRKILDKLWQIAYADGYLDPHEEHVIRKISDLFYLPHSQYIQSKLANQPSLE